MCSEQTLTTCFVGGDVFVLCMFVHSSVSLEETYRKHDEYWSHPSLLSICNTCDNGFRLEIKISVCQLGWQRTESTRADCDRKSAMETFGYSIFFTHKDNGINHTEGAKGLHPIEACKHCSSNAIVDVIKHKDDADLFCIARSKCNIPFSLNQECNNILTTIRCAVHNKWITALYPKLFSMSTFKAMRTYPFVWFDHHNKHLAPYTFWLFSFDILPIIVL